MPFGEYLDLKLIKLVEENPVLYNAKNDKLYTEADTREAAWQKIGDALKMPASACKTRWVNIRDNMRRKIRLRERPNNRYKKNTISKYKYEKNLVFVLPYLKGTERGSEEYLADDDSLVEQVFVDDEQYETERKPNLSDLIVLNRHDEASFNTSISQEKSDPINVFLEAVGSTLRNLNPYYLNQAKSRIFQVVQDCELQQIVKESEQPSTSQDNVEN